jgi:hypothetical protein
MAIIFWRKEAEEKWRGLKRRQANRKMVFRAGSNFLQGLKPITIGAHFGPAEQLAEKLDGRMLCNNGTAFSRAISCAK